MRGQIWRRNWHSLIEKVAPLISNLTANSAHILIDTLLSSLCCLLLLLDERSNHGIVWIYGFCTSSWPIPMRPFSFRNCRIFVQHGMVCVSGRIRIDKWTHCRGRFLCTRIYCLFERTWRSQNWLLHSWRGSFCLWRVSKWRLIVIIIIGFCLGRNSIVFFCFYTGRCDNSLRFHHESRIIIWFISHDSLRYVWMNLVGLCRPISPTIILFGRGISCLTHSFLHIILITVAANVDTLSILAIF